MLIISVAQGQNQRAPLIDLPQIVPVHNRKGVSVRPPFPVQKRQVIKRPVRCGKRVGFIAGLLTFPTADTPGKVHQTTKGSGGTLDFQARDLLFATATEATVAPILFHKIYKHLPKTMPTGQYRPCA